MLKKKRFLSRIIKEYTKYGHADWLRKKLHFFHSGRHEQTCWGYDEFYYLGLSRKQTAKLRYTLPCYKNKAMLCPVKDINTFLLPHFELLS